MSQLKVLYFADSSGRVGSLRSLHTFCALLHFCWIRTSFSLHARELSSRALIHCRSSLISFSFCFFFSFFLFTFQSQIQIFALSLKLCVYRLFLLYSDGFLFQATTFYKVFVIIIRRPQFFSFTKKTAKELER